MTEVLHTLVLKNDGWGVCGCGDGWQGTTPTKIVKQWEAHVESIRLLDEAKELAWTEREARRLGEEDIRKLLELGFTSHQISKHIGNDDDGKLMVSPTLVQRIGRNEHKETPRRRRRASGGTST